MVRFTLIFSLVFAFLVSVAHAAPTQITGRPDGNCVIYTLCDAATGLGTCGGAGNERFIRPGGYGKVAFMADKSTSVQAWTVTLYTVSQGVQYHATKRTAINASPLKYTAPAVWYVAAEIPLGDVFAVVGGTLSSGTVTVEAKFCPSGR